VDKLCKSNVISRQKYKKPREKISGGFSGQNQCPEAGQQFLLL
jgi:hypothetical protein